jgi:hypothetical protein
MKTVIRFQSQLPVRRSYKPARQRRFRPVIALRPERSFRPLLTEQSAETFLAAVREDVGYVGNGDSS